MFWTLVFGVGIEAPSRYNASIASVNSSFLRRSGVRKADANALSKGPPAAKLLSGVLFSQANSQVPESLALRAG